MSFNGVFEKRVRSAKQDSIAARAFAGYADCILQGCAITYTGTTVTIAPGAMIIGGRIINFDSQTTIDIANPVANGYGQLKLIINLSLAESSETLLQAYTQWSYSGTSTFSALTQSDINLSGTLYECEIAVVQITNSVAVGITRSIAQTLGANGYRKLPSGLIIQWGSNQTNTESGGYGLFIITLPISFPTARVGNFFSLNTPDDSEWVLTHPVLINTGSNLGMIRVVANIAKTNKNITLNWMVLGY